MDAESRAFIARPTEVLKAYMSATGHGGDFDWGRLAMGLEIVTLIRTLESIPVVNDAERQGTVACLVTLLREQGLEEVWEFYDALAEWRKPNFVRESSVSVVAGVVYERGARGDNGASSPRAIGGHTPTPQDTSRARPEARRDRAQGASPIRGQLALPFGEERETPSE